MQKQQITKYLGELEQHRLEEIKRLNLCYFLYLIPFAMVLGGMFIANEGLAPFLYLGAVFSWIGIFGGVIGKLKGSYQNKVKAKVFKLMAKKMDLDLQYDSEERIEESEYNNANLFREHSTYRGEDLFKGTYRNYNIAFSEVRATRRINKRTTTRFDGVFFVVDIPTMRGNLKVIHKDQWFQKSKKVNWRKVDPNLLDGLVPGFSEEFKIWTEDVKTARYVVNTTLLPLLMQWSKSFDEKISLAIKGNKLYFAWSNRADMFEMDIRSSLKDSETTAKMLEEFMQCIEILGKLIDCTEEVYQQDLEDEEIVEGGEDNRDTYNSFLLD